MLGRARSTVAAGAALAALVVGCRGGAEDREPLATEGRPPSLRGVDFETRTYPGALCGDLAIDLPPPPATVEVRDGRSEPWGAAADAGLAVHLVGVADLTGDGNGEAAVQVTCSSGGSLREDRVVVYAPTDEGPVQLAVVGQPADRAAAGLAPELVGAAIDAGRLVLTWARWAEGDPHCCPSGADSYALRWDGTAFAVVDGPTPGPVG